MTDSSVILTESGLTEGWNDSFWHECGLGDLADEGYKRIGKCNRFCIIYM